MKPLEDVVVLDFTRVLAGPYCTLTLADLGARVIKIEPPEGDLSRHYGPFLSGVSAYFVSVNRGKRSVVIDLKELRGIELALDLAAKSDVVVENFRPGVMDRMGLGYDAVKTRRGDIIYASLSGFGQTGPRVMEPAYDMVVQAMSGIVSITGHPGGPPARVGVSIADLAAGLFGAVSIVSALRRREVSGEGARIDVAMLDSLVALLENAIARYDVSGISPGPLGAAHPSIYPFDLFTTKDRPIAITVGSDAQFKKLAGMLGHPEWAADPRFSANPARCDNQSVLKALMEKSLSRLESGEWLKILAEGEIPAGPYNDIEAMTQDPQIVAREMIRNLPDPVAGLFRVAGSPMKIADDRHDNIPAPQLGEHTDAILGELLGMNKDLINQLKDRKVIA